MQAMQVILEAEISLKVSGLIRLGSTGISLVRTVVRGQFGEATTTNEAYAIDAVRWAMQYIGLQRRTRCEGLNIT
jgi:hypothetical protein